MICDLAETYGIYDYERLLPTQVATFSFGLRDNSRVKMRLFNQKITLDQMLSARMADELTFLAWAKTVDGQKNINRPKSILDILLNPEKKMERENICYASGEDFLKAWHSITEDKENG